MGQARPEGAGTKARTAAGQSQPEELFGMPAVSPGHRAVPQEEPVPLTESHSACNEQHRALGACLAVLSVGSSAPPQ